MKPGDFFDYVPLDRPRLRLTTALDLVVAIGTAAVIAAWLAGQPLFYSTTAPVLSPFTALSLFLMVAVRQARLRLDTWPMALSLAMTGLVLGGNLSSLVMLAMTPAELWASFPGLVLTSVMTSIGLITFCAYDLVVSMRRTPDSALIVDDLLIHLALVPGGLSLLGHLLGNPTYLSIHDDPRVGISLLEMAFLAAGWSSRAVFAALFVNQFVAPLVVALMLSKPAASGPGVELFVMLAGVVATMSFLLAQAHLMRRGRETRAA